MPDLTTVRRRLDHVQTLIETAQSHIDSPADSQALARAYGLLEQAHEDLNEIEADATDSTGRDGS